MIDGLSHLTFIVRDLDRMSRIIIDVFGGEEVYSSGERTFSLSPERFFVAGGLWIAITEGEPLTSRTYNHVAFKIEPERLDACKRAIESLGLEMRETRPRVAGEGQSIHFYDDDNHLFELHAGKLDARVAAYRERENDK
jgi:fosfomycin resistance protein FosX